MARMLKKKNSDIKIDYKLFAVNGVVLLIFGYGLLSLTHQLLNTETTAQCRERYASYVRFPETLGANSMIAIDDLQHFLDDDISGMSDFTRVHYSGQSTKNPAIEVALMEGSRNPRRLEEQRGGISFVWRPHLPSGIKTACLSYRVWIPQDFDFAAGGTFPGLFGGTRPNVDGYDEEPNGFSSHILWNANGTATVRAFTSERPKESGEKYRLGYEKLAKGRWVSISQEIGLNTPGKDDGTLRVWMDGSLKYESYEMKFRENDEFKFSGVLAELFYGTRKIDEGAPKDTFMRVTPFELYWN